VGDLQPLGDELSPQARDLAAALRGLFEGLRISVRRYGLRRHLDPGTVSRYLNGTRMPPWQFIEDLFREVAKTCKASPTALTMIHLKKLHDAVLEASNSPLRTMQLLQEQLARADQESCRAQLREQALVDALEVKQHRIAELEVRLNLALSEPCMLPRQTTARPSHESSLDALCTDHAQLLAEVAILSEDLERVQELHKQAELRCEELERKLGTAELRVQAANGGVAGTIRLVHVLRTLTVMMVVDGKFVGSGTLINRNTVLTCAHVVWGAKEVQVNLLDRKRTISATVEALYPASLQAPEDRLMYPFPDLAVIRLRETVDNVPDTGVTAASPVAGDAVLAGGISARSGKLEVLPTLLRVAEPFDGWLRYSNSEMSPGMEGGPLLQLETGRICGLIRASGRDGKGGLAVPSAAFPTASAQVAVGELDSPSWWILPSGEGEQTC
jgi:trypsin-like peptidase